ncbi:MAG: Uncharacterized protein XE10_0048 [Methanoculleus marisnigri]|jgi:hypothetical protein|uniref:DUF7982 domain-containing protein n=1 Tax=Methanoculleus marisnigri TaxID=2198 RepID=A0A101GSX7_9EURY|nr:hypothetical protein [Methanoculleus marisnigri]KUK63949.1 MAG: Uncharacterized protein XD82_0021 [Methanoculleus marisnigri]KUL05688.1 MAG: Uncharacterized protein XE10_0048 [Methanoculleus marisnigri]
MRRIPFGEHATAGLILIGTAAVLMLVLVFTARSDLASASVILCSAVFFLVGIFFVTLQKGDSVDADIAGLLAADAVVSTARHAADLGIAGNGFVIPVRNAADGATPVHFVPVTEGGGIPEIVDTYSYLTDAACPGILLVPSGRTLLTTLQKEFNLHVPEESEAIGTAVREVFEDVLEIADRVETTVSDDQIVVEIRGYRLFSGCVRVREESAKICTMYPCPACSLVACIFAVGLDRPVAIRQIAAEQKTRSLTIVCGILPGPGTDA